MTGLFEFLADPEDTREEIMRATYLALSEHGYSDLTIQRISEEFPKSKSLLYHHYDSKDDLLLDFMEYLIDRFEGQFPPWRADDADEYVEHVVAYSFAPADAMNEEFARAVLELRTQAAHDERYREYFARTDRFSRRHVEHLIESGVEDGVFRDVDPSETASFFGIVFHGTLFQSVTGDGESVSDARREFERYVRESLLAAD